MGRQSRVNQQSGRLQLIATSRPRAPFWHTGVVDHQHRARPTHQPVRLLGKHPPQRCVVPGSATDEMVQLIVTAQSKPCRNGLHAFRSIEAEQAARIKRPPATARAAPHHVEERRQPTIEIVTKSGRPGHSSCSAESQLDTKPRRDRTSAKVVLARNSPDIQDGGASADSLMGTYSGEIQNAWISAMDANSNKGIPRPSCSPSRSSAAPFLRCLPPKPAISGMTAARYLSNRSASASRRARHRRLGRSRWLPQAW